MHFIKAKSVLQVLQLPTTSKKKMPLQVTKNDISLDAFTCNLAFGSNAGDDYGFVGYFDRSLTKITIYVEKAAIGSLKVEKNDGTCLTIGTKQSGSPIVWSFPEGQLFSKAQVFTNTKTLSGLCLLTKEGKKFEVYIPDKSSGPHVPHDIIVEGQHGPGRLIGVFGNAGPCLESLGLAVQRNGVPKNH